MTLPCRRSLALVLLVGAVAGIHQGCRRSDPPDPASIVLITIDTLRADHLSTYGYFRQTSPNLDELAAEAVVFDRALTTMATTLPAHASLMTSTRTTTHGLKGNFQHFRVAFEGRGNIRTWAEMLTDLGYETAAFVSAAPVRSHTGIERGFETFDQPVEKSRRADVTIDRVLAWLQQKREGSFFLWVHLWDPHRPRQPPPPYDEAFSTDERLVSFLLERAVTKPFDRFVQRENNAYDGEILFTDHQIGRVLEALKAQEEWQETAIVVTSDHGEGLGQHDWMDHGRIYNEQLFVPLILKLPAGRGPRGVRIQTTASLIDVIPTLVTALELPIADEDRAQFEGLDLLAGDRKRMGVLSEQSQRVDEPGTRYSLTSVRWKYFHRTEGEDELYDLEKDLYETENVIAQNPQVAERMRRQVVAILESSSKDMDDSTQVVLDEEVVRQLRALGYLDGPSGGEAPSLWQGGVVWGHEVREFHPCGSQQALWVVDESDELWSRYRQLTRGMPIFTEIYAQVRAVVASPPTSGFGVRYPGTLRVQEVLSMGVEGRGCEDE